MAATVSSPLVFIGTYTGDRPKGVYCYRLGSETGALEYVDSFAVGPNPSFLALHPGAHCLYAVNEAMTWEGQAAGGVTACTYHPFTGHVAPINSQSSAGTGPCHVAVEPGGRFALVANYMGGSVGVLPIAAGGALEPASDLVQHVGSGPHPRRQREPHAHSVTLTPDGRLALVADLGLDRVAAYRLDIEAGRLHPAPASSIAVRPGAGPRHLAFHPNGRWLYVINEIDSTLDAFTYDAAAGTFSPLATIPTLPEDYAGESTCADVHVHPNGRFVYGSNRGHDSILVAAIDERGIPTPVGHTATAGRTPRNFALSPDGRYLLAANQDSDNVVVFAIDEETGALSPTGHVATLPAPVCIRFAPPA